MYNLHETYMLGTLFALPQNWNARYRTTLLHRISSMLLGCKQHNLHLLYHTQKHDTQVEENTVHVTFTGW